MQHTYTHALVYTQYIWAYKLACIHTHLFDSRERGLHRDMEIRNPEQKTDFNRAKKKS